MIYDMIYLLTAVGLTPGDNRTVHIYTQTIHRTTQITTEQHKQQLIWKSAGRAPSLRVLPPGICLRTEEKARKNLSQVSSIHITIQPHITIATHTQTHT